MDLAGGCSKQPPGERKSPEQSRADSGGDSARSLRADGSKHICAARNVPANSENARADAFEQWAVQASIRHSVLAGLEAGEGPMPKLIGHRSEIPHAPIVNDGMAPCSWEPGRVDELAATMTGVRGGGTWGLGSWVAGRGLAGVRGAGDFGAR